MPELSENRVKHLEMIQAIIARMANESARMKQFALTAVGILASMSKAADSPTLAIVGAILTLMFWMLDARYLHQERVFRGHYDDVRQQSGMSDFDMSPSKETAKKHSVAAPFFSWSTILIYMPLLLISAFLGTVTPEIVTGS